MPGISSVDTYPFLSSTSFDNRWEISAHYHSTELFTKETSITFPYFRGPIQWSMKEFPSSLSPEVPRKRLRITQLRRCVNILYYPPYFPIIRKRWIVILPSYQVSVSKFIRDGRLGCLWYVWLRVGVVISWIPYLPCWLNRARLRMFEFLLCNHVAAFGRWYTKRHFDTKIRLR